MTLEYFRLFYHSHIMPMVNKGENILKSPKTKSMNLPPYVFELHHAAKIRSKLSFTVLEKNEQNHRLKKNTLRCKNSHTCGKTYVRIVGGSEQTICGWAPFKCPDVIFQEENCF